MTYSEAKAALRGPLRFGNDEQIKAVRLLGDIQDVRDAVHEAVRPMIDPWRNYSKRAEIAASHAVEELKDEGLVEEVP